MWLSLLVLFAALSPGVLFTIPSLGKKMGGKLVIAAMHALLFVIIINLFSLIEGFAGRVPQKPVIQKSRANQNPLEQAQNKLKSANASVSHVLKGATTNAAYLSSVYQELMSSYADSISGSDQRALTRYTNASNKFNSLLKTIIIQLNSVPRNLNTAISATRDIRRYGGTVGTGITLNTLTNTIGITSANPAVASGAPPECGNLGRPMKDNQTLREYTIDECNSLNGNWSENGECLRREGGSFSFGCGILNIIEATANEERRKANEAAAAAAAAAAAPAGSSL